MAPVFRALCLAFGIFAAGAAAAGAEETADPAAIAALSAAKIGDWSQAYTKAGESRDALTLKIVRWLDYTRSNPGGRFAEIASFIEQNPGWPAPKVLLRRAEESLASESDEVAAEWLKRHPPQNGIGQIRAAAILINKGETEAGTAALRTAWIQGDFLIADEQKLMQRYGGQLRSEDHQKRYDRLMWDGQLDPARRTLPLVPADYRMCAEARLAFAADTGNPEAVLAKVPQPQHSDPGLAFEEAKWWLKRGNYDNAAGLLLAHDDTPIRPALWWKERLNVARRLLAGGNSDIAYRLVRPTPTSDNDEAVDAEAEFLRGYVALR